MGGMFIVTMVILAMVKRARNDDWGNQLPIVPRQYQHIVEAVAPKKLELVPRPMTGFEPRARTRRGEIVHAAR